MKVSKGGKFPKGQAGLALVEFALLVPLLVLLLLGLIEVGRFAYYGIVVGNAAHAGVQYGAQSSSTAGDITGMQNAAKTDGQNNITAISAVASDLCACWNSSTGTGTTPAACTSPPATCATGVAVTYVQVHTSGTFSPLFNYPKLPSTFSVSATALMRVRN